MGASCLLSPALGQPFTAPADEAASLTLNQAVDPATKFPLNLTLYFENDGTAVKPNANTDRHYTSAQALSIAKRIEGPAPLAEALGLEHDHTAVGFVLAQQIFTSSDIEDEVPAEDDRPYAGYAFAGVFWQRQLGHSLDHLQLDLGVVGPSSGAEDAQNAVHSIGFAPIAEGWDIQLRDEVAVQLGYRKRWRIDLDAWADSLSDRGDFGVQWIPEIGLDLGTVYRRAHLGSTLRLGVNLPDDFGATRLAEIGSAAGDPVTGLSLYGYARIIGRYVAWNTFLDGSNWRDPSRSVSKNPWVAQGTLGAAIEWRGGNWVFGFSYGQTYLTKEFEAQQHHDSYGFLAARFTYLF